MEVFSVIGDVIGGALQTLVGLLNALINALPNPDPFPEIIEDMDTESLVNMGFVTYWLDAFVGIDFAVVFLGAFTALLIASIVFAGVYFAVKAVKP